VTNAEINRKLSSLETQMGDVRLQVVDELGKVRSSVEVLGAQVETHLGYIQQAIECQEQGLKQCREELFGHDGHSGLRSKWASVSTDLRHTVKQVWFIWTAIGGMAVALLIRELVRVVQQGVN
jgi:hypothetical protein